jgi:ribosome-binding protein aMBF1 (putative translation factor)
MTANSAREIFHECDICGRQFSGSGAIGDAADHILNQPEDCQSASPA